MSYQSPYQSHDQGSQQSPPFGSFPGAQHYHYGSPQMMTERPHSKFGIASFIMGVIVGLGEFALVVVAGVMESQNPGGMDEKDPQVVVLGLLLLFGLLLAVIGAILGVVGMFEANKKKVFAILGLVFNGLILALVVLLMVVGLAMGA